MKIFLSSVAVMIVSFAISIALFKKTDFNFNDIAKKLSRHNIAFSNIKVDEENDSFTFETSIGKGNTEVIKKNFPTGTISLIDIKGIDAADIEIKDVKKSTEIKVQLECITDFIEHCDKMVQLKNGILQILAEPVKNKATTFIKHLKILLPPNAFNLNLALGAGDIMIKNVQLAKADITVGVGNIEVKNLKTDNSIFKSGTGDVEIKGLDSTNNFTQIISGIGNVEVEVINPAPKLVIESGTGNIELKSPEEKNFTLEIQMGIGSKDLISGYTKSKDQYVYGKGQGNVLIKSGVGNIEIN